MKRATPAVKISTKVYHISIHALVKRATAPPQTQFAQNFISIHALVKRATMVTAFYDIED